MRLASLYLLTTAASVVFATAAQAQVSAPANEQGAPGTAPDIGPGTSTAAQTSAPTIEPEDSVGLEEIVVTAQRQSQNLQRTALSVVAFTGDALRERGISSIDTLALQTPGLAIKTDFGATNPNIFIRGVGIGDFNANVTGAVGVYIDEVYQSSPAGQLFQFYDVERVEVLRGPQGTLYGRNTTAGAINIISRRPTDTLRANATAEYGRFDDLLLEGGIGGPIIADALNFRVSATRRKRDGLIRNTYTGADRLAPDRVGDLDSWAARGQLEFKPTTELTLLLNGHYGKSDATGVQFKHRGILDPTALAAGRIAPCGIDALRALSCVDALGYRDPDTSPNTVQYNNPIFERVEAYGTNLKIDLDLGGHTLTSISAYERTKRNSRFDGDETPLNILDATHRPDSDEYTQELRLASPTEGRFRYVLGGYYFREDLDFAGTFDLFRQVRPAIAAAATQLGLGPPLSLGFNPTGGPALAAQLGNGVFAFPTIAPLYQYRQKVESWAAFGQVNFDLTDDLTATGGLRYSDERRRFDYQSSLVEPFITIPLAANNEALGNNRTDFSDLSFRAALEWQATRDIFGFASVSRASKSGGFNGAFLTSQAQTQPFDDETLTSYELGLKTQFLDRRLRFNVTGFLYDYRDIQIYTLESTGGIPQQILSNAPRARLYGAEFEVLARPIDQLVVSLGLSLLDSELTRSFVGNNGTDQKGNELAYAPKVTSSGSATWTQPLGANSGSLIFAGDYSYQAKAYTDTRNLERLRTESYFIVGARLGYQTPDERLQVALYGRNIFDERAVTYIADLGDFGFDRLKYTDRATYGISARFNF